MGVALGALANGTFHDGAQRCWGEAPFLRRCAMRQGASPQHRLSWPRGLRGFQTIKARLCWLWTNPESTHRTSCRGACCLLYSHRMGPEKSPDGPVSLHLECGKCLSTYGFLGLKGLKEFEEIEISKQRGALLAKQVQKKLCADALLLCT